MVVLNFRGAATSMHPLVIIRAGLLFSELYPFEIWRQTERDNETKIDGTAPLSLSFYSII